MTELGFNVVDVNVTLERTPGSQSSSSVGNSISVQQATPQDHEDVLNIAANCFVYSRFHLDPLLTQEMANMVKREWVRNYVKGKRGEALLVAKLDGKPVGFLAVLANKDSNGSCRVIDLVGVAPAHQGRGVGRAIVDHFIASSDGLCDSLRVGTQAANIPSLRLYESCGFRVADTTFVLHAHVAANGQSE